MTREEEEAREQHAFEQLIEKVKGEAKRLAREDYETSYQKLLAAGIQPTVAQLRDMSEVLLQRPLFELEQALIQPTKLSLEKESEG